MYDFKVIISSRLFKHYASFKDNTRQNTSLAQAHIQTKDVALTTSSD